MSDVRLLGGEMEFWSDPAPGGGPLVAALVREVLPRSGHVVLLGPHPPEVLDLLDEARADVALLLRSVPDAERVAAEHPAFLVASGDLGRADAEQLGGPADLLLALGGLEVCASADAGWRSWADLAAASSTLLADDGVAVVGLAGSLSTATLAASHRREADASPSAWFPTLGHDASRPADAAGVAAAFSRPGATSDAWLVAPGLDAPRLALPAGLAPLTTGTVAGALLERASSTTPTPAVDPRVVVRDAVGQGLATHLAPARVVVVGAVPARRAVVLDDDGLPEAIDADTVVGPGDLLESRFLERVVRHDVLGVRRDLETVARFLDDAPVGTSPAPTDLLLDGDDCRVVPGAGTRTWVAGGLALAFTVLALAERLEELGWRRPWPDDLDADGLATVLVGLTGREPGETDWAEVRELRRRGAERDEPVDDDPTAPDAVQRLRTENAALRGRVRALESALRGRDRQLWSDRADRTASTPEDRRALRAAAQERRDAASDQP